jgi:RNA polymerase sigma-70 factor (ECF subfamily)
LKAYLYRIAHNWITDYYRQRTPVQDIDAWNADDSLMTPAAEDSGYFWERQQIRQALLQLPEVQRQVVMLRFFEEWSHEDIATATGKTVEATRALQYRALNGLRTLLVTAEM